MVVIVSLDRGGGDGDGDGGRARRVKRVRCGVGITSAPMTERTQVRFCSGQTFPLNIQ